MYTCNDKIKVTIVGCGNVGATIAYATLLKGLAAELTIIDINPDKAQGLRMDLEHSLSFTENCSLHSSSDLRDARDSSLIIITAGARQHEGESRLELSGKNKTIFAQMIPELIHVAPNSHYLIVSNPLDVMTYEAFKLSGLPRNQIFGSGTLLDTARYRYHISEKLHVSPKSINAYILGEHGDSSFAVTSCADIAGVPLIKFPGFTDEIAHQCLALTKTAASRIIHNQGFTCYSIATAVTEIMKAIFEDSHEIFPVSSVLDDYYGISDIALSVPCIIGKAGVIEQVKIPLNESELTQLRSCAELVNSYKT